MLGIAQRNRRQEAVGGRQAHQQACLGREQTLDIGGGGPSSEIGGFGGRGGGFENPGRPVPTDEVGGRAGGGVVKPLDTRVGAQLSQLSGGVRHRGFGGASNRSEEHTSELQ